MIIKIPDILYHGTISEFTSIDVSKGKPYKDFGKGFYAAIKNSHAASFARLVKRDTIIRLERTGRPHSHIQSRIYTLSVNTSMLNIPHFHVKYFPVPDLEWVDFVITNRESRGKPHDYDIVIGPTADDDTATCLDAYRDGLYGEVGSHDARATLLRNLEPDNLPIQVYFGTPDAARTISIKKVEILP
ncbi:MAG: DUF3990 domain-containing protein [Defluviitaleaceae bacterium]|nr:DUF3990 domain-containing protein [Defluviitaleaceae bacterium]